jgi:hypothetical protein
MAGKSYSWRDRNNIEFTKADIAGVIADLSKEERFKPAANIQLQFVKGGVLPAIQALAVALDGVVKSDYAGITIQVPKDNAELRDTAVEKLRSNEAYFEIRDKRAAEQGIEPQSD